MKKEEILEKSREENKNKDVYEMEVGYKAGTVAAVAMLILALIYFTYEIVSGKGNNPAFYSLIAIYNAIFYGYRAVKLEKNRKINIFATVVWMAMTIMLMIFYFTKQN